MADEGGAGLLAQVRGFPARAGPVDLDLRLGDVVHVRGANGSGKTSLLRALAGLDAPLRPESVRVQGTAPHALTPAGLARRVRAVWSRPRASLVGLTVAGEARLRGIPIPPGMNALAGRDVATLSAGEARRVALAFVAASQAPLLLLDEPHDALDPAGELLLDAVVRDAARTGAVVVTDHSGWAQRHATRTLDLGSTAIEAWPTAPRPDGPVVLHATGQDVWRNGQSLRVPGFALGPGLHAVTGPNGAGKTTLLRRLAGLGEASGVAIAGSPPQPGHNVRMLQDDGGELFAEPTVGAELLGASDPWGLVPQALLDRHPLSLSAGEAQRVALAKALGRPAPVHLLDEPEAHLDTDGRRRLARAIADRTAAGACVVAATHDPAMAAAARTRIEVGQ